MCASSSPRGCVVCVGVCAAPPAWEVEFEERSDALDRRQRVPYPRELYPPHLDDPEPPKPLIPTTTDDDRAGRLQSMERSLNRALFLLVKRRNRHTQEERWTLPSVPYKALPYADIPPRDAAQAAVVECVGSKLDVHVLSKAPVAYHRWEYSQAYVKKSGTKQRGCKMLIMHGVYCGGVVDEATVVAGLGEGEGVIHWAWLTREQVQERLDDDELRCILLDISMEDADYADGIDEKELQRRRQHNQQYWEPMDINHTPRREGGKKRLDGGEGQAGGEGERETKGEYKLSEMSRLWSHRDEEEEEEIKVEDEGEGEGGGEDGDEDEDDDEDDEGEDEDDDEEEDEEEEQEDEGEGNKDRATDDKKSSS